jgi:hypothetical protein
MGTPPPPFVTTFPDPSQARLHDGAAATTTPPPCGLWEGDEFDASNDGPCVLPDGEVMGSAIWIRRNPGRAQRVACLI